MISSDGHRLSIMEKDVSTDVDQLTLNDKTLIPKKGIQELKKFCESRDTIEISFESNQMVVREGEAVLVVRLKHGEFPQYKAIVDAVLLDNKVSINRIPFLESLKRINLLPKIYFIPFNFRLKKVRWCYLPIMLIWEMQKTNKKLNILGNL